jgi:hypothetical protein
MMENKMNQLNVTKETQEASAEKALAELKALFHPEDPAMPGAATQLKEKEKPLYFDRFKGKLVFVFN